VRGLGEARLAAFVDRERYSGRQTPAQLLSKLRGAPAGRAGELELGIRRQLVLTLVATLRTLNAQIKELERQIAAAIREHPDGAIFLSLFKRSVITAAELLTEMGDCRARYPNREALAGDAGQAAVAIESGKRKAASFRWGCNKRLRSAFCTLADSCRHWYRWAQDLYAAARARHHDHPRALRTVGRAWVSRRLALLARRCALRFRPPPRPATTHHCHHPHLVGPRPDIAATQRMAGAAVAGRAARRTERAALDSKPPSAKPCARPARRAQRLTQGVCFARGGRMAQCICR
jgi:hypothetical protein